ncbi:Mu-like prophage DNA circulation protein [Desulfuromonas soudanensis]|uniref:Mu-like prophage DNA circulation protein n=1 Tax=Desulfuromonas soudanensis TaxID=1603606 RepID=A0A0M4D4T8_9BACT|nr:DNA circularization N-terminal domain-containing protein [Desulfuromonas soudanensis]ALC15660.1 Mu-like prophage DNA circulation protein [Desulfuromonas soudanensis]
MDRFAATLDEFPLDVETLDDSFEKAVAVYEYPYRDGAGTDDLGQKARSLRLRCYWWEETYQKHFEFLDHLKQRSLFSLTHPKYGLIKGRIRSVSVRHDDRQELAEVDIDFVEDLSSQETPAVYPDVKAGGEESFLFGQSELQDNLRTSASAELGEATAAALFTQSLDPSLGIAEQFPGVSLKTRNWLKAVEAAVSAWDASGSLVANPAGSLVSTTAFAANLPGRVVGSVARAAERYALGLVSLRSSPARFLSAYRAGLPDFSALNDNYATVATIAGTQRLALEAAELYGADEESRDGLRRSEQTPAFDASGRFIAAPAGDQVMTAIDLERSLAEVRTALQEAIDLARGMESLKAAARQLLEHVSQVKLERDRLVTLLLDNPMPLHLLCLHQGLSYRYAARILAINSTIIHPSFVRGEVQVYV